MANEIVLSSSLKFTKGGVAIAPATTAKTQNCQTSLTHATHIVQNVGNTREALIVNDVDISNATGNEYFVRLFNMDATHTVTVEVKTGASTYQVVGVMQPGEFWGPVRMPKLDASGYGGLYLTSSTGTSDVESVVAEAGNPAL